MGDTNGQVVAGGNGRGNRLDQLNLPTDVLIDKETDSFIICDWQNRRVVRWSRRSGTTQGEILIANIVCWGLAMDDQRYLYISDTDKHEVRRYQIGDKNGALVAGGNGTGDGLNQLNVLRYIFVDQQQNVYVSDNNNHRVMKWNKGAKEGIVVAGGQGQGDALTQLSHPCGLFVDTLGTIYVADAWNHRVMRWPKGAKQGTVIVGGNGQGAGANQFNWPIGGFITTEKNEIRYILLLNKNLFISTYLFYTHQDQQFVIHVQYLIGMEYKRNRMKININFTMLLNIIQVDNIELYLMIRLIQRLLKYTSIKHIDYQLLIDSLGKLREIAKKIK
ncbi:unnamed protein product [Rotaria sordida]|uniref:Uncharacterized protein n=1 Tax=Rotaria sordida TaxID=392033 RepID=A0A815A4J6_9BILA|nr:unnamed protein product [Rotaria sordida]CAF1533220.1 unnamed protein product [Rotaria sordida]